MSSINVGKGMFRLWVIVAACWIIGITIGYWEDLAGRSCCSDEWSGRIDAIVTMFLPPASLMLLGLASAWVLRGFRTSKP